MLRYFNVFGPYQDPTSHYSGVLALFCRRMLAGEQPTIFGDGEQTRDFTYRKRREWQSVGRSLRRPRRYQDLSMTWPTTMSTLNQTFAILSELTGYSGGAAYALAHRRYP